VLLEAFELELVQPVPTPSLFIQQSDVAITKIKACNKVCDLIEELI